MAKGLRSKVALDKSHPDKQEETPKCIKYKNKDKNSCSSFVKIVKTEMILLLG